MKPQTQMQVGLGEAIERHNNLHKRMTAGIAIQEEKDEYKLLSTALNEIKLDLGFDCNDDGVPDTIDIFHQTATTSCCRFIPADVKTVKAKSTSRSTSAKKKPVAKKKVVAKKKATSKKKVVAKKTTKK